MSAQLLTEQERQTARDEHRTERVKRYNSAALAGLIGKVIALAAGFVTIPIVAGYLGAERYGIWVTLTSFVGLMQFADLGIGNGLINAIGAAYAKGDRQTAKRYVSTGFYALTAGALLGGALVLALFAIATPQRLFGYVSSTVAKDFALACYIVVLYIVVSVPMGIVQRVQTGYQEGRASNTWQIAGQLSGLLALIVATRLRAGLPNLMLVWLGAPLLVAAANWTVQFHITRPWLRPSLGYFDGRTCRELLSTGLVFLILNITAQVLFLSDNLILAHAKLPSAIAEYALALRVFSVVPMMLGIWLAPLWPAYAEAQQRGDHSWIRSSILSSLLKAGLISSTCSATIILFRELIFTHWVGRQYVPSLSLCFACCAWTILQSLGVSIAMFMNGCGWVKLQAKLATAMLILSVPLKVCGYSIAGSKGLLWAAVLAYTLSPVAPLIVLRDKLISVDLPLES